MCYLFVRIIHETVRRVCHQFRLEKSCACGKTGHKLYLALTLYLYLAHWSIPFTHRLPSLVLADVFTLWSGPFWESRLLQNPGPHPRKGFPDLLPPPPHLPLSRTLWTQLSSSPAGTSEADCCIAAEAESQIYPLERIAVPVNAGGIRKVDKDNHSSKTPSKAAHLFFFLPRPHILWIQPVFLALCAKPSVPWANLTIGWSVYIPVTPVSH